MWITHREPPSETRLYSGRVLPQTGSVLGVDVGYSKTKKTTAFCRLSWSRRNIEWRFASAMADPSSREKALAAVCSGTGESDFLSVAIDGPLRPGLHLLYTYRTAECLLSRGAFQKRGKPGPTNGGSGPKLHQHATRLAELVLDHSDVKPTEMPFSAADLAVYEAFPNLFLGVLCDDVEYPNRPAKGRYWTDCLFPLVTTKLDRLLRNLLPRRRPCKLLSSEGDHEEVAALTCAITALVAAAGNCIAVGSRTDGYVVLPPLPDWGFSPKRERWAERELRHNVQGLSCDGARVHPSEIYSGRQLLDWSR